MATGETINIRELVATGEAKVQSVQTALDGRIVGLPLCLLAIYSSSLVVFYLSCFRVGP